MSDPSAADTDSRPVGEPTPSPSTPAERPTPEGAGEPSGERKSESLIDAVAELLQTVVNYLRQEAAGIMRDKVVLPGQRLGRLIAFALAAAFLLALGLGFVAVALLLLLAQFLTWPGALGLIGGVLLIGSAVLTYLKVRSLQT